MTSTRPSSLAVQLPELDFPAPEFDASTNSLSASVFVPMHYEAGYAYPLIVWLSGSNEGSRHVTRVMPKLSLRNYFGLSPAAPRNKKHSASQHRRSEKIRHSTPTNPLSRQHSESQPECDELFYEIEKLRRRYNISRKRIFIAGCGNGGRQALQIAMTHPDYFAGVISLCGDLPDSPLSLGNVRESRRLPILISQSRDDAFFSEEALCNCLKMFHVAGFSVTARQYPGEHQLNDQMLHDIDVWIMELINGFDMTQSNKPLNEFN